MHIHESKTIIVSFRLEESTDSCRSVRELPDSLTSVRKCPAPRLKPVVPVHPTFSLMDEHEIPITVSRDDFCVAIVTYP